MILTLDDFDTKILNKNVYKLYLESEIEKADLSELKDVKSSIIFCFSIFSTKNTSLLIKAGFNLISIRNTYKLDLTIYRKKEVPRLQREYRILDKTHAKDMIKKEDIKALAKTVFETSRYGRDLELGTRSLDIYTNWLNNSIDKDYADQVYLIFNSRAIGIITIKIKHNCAYIDLLGVLKEYRNKKLASILLKKAVEHIVSKGIVDIFVITEGENIPANIFYQANSFLVQKVELVFHKHTL